MLDPRLEKAPDDVRGHFEPGSGIMMVLSQLASEEADFKETGTIFCN